MKGGLRKLEKKIRKIYFKWIEEKNVQKSGTGTGKKWSIDYLYTCKITFLASWSHPVTVRVIKKFSQFMCNFQSNENISIEMVEKKNSYQSKQNNLDMKNDSQGWKKRVPCNVFPKSIYGNLSKLQKFGNSVQCHTMLETLTPTLHMNTNEILLFRCASLPTSFPSLSLSLTSSLPLLLLSLHPLSSSLSRAMVIFQIKCETANC